MGKMKPDGEKKISSSVQLFIAFIIACIALDLFETWCRVSNPIFLKSISCAVRPFLFISDPLFSRQILEFAAAGCRTEATLEPLSSVIAFMIKLNLAVVILLPYWIYLLFARPSELLELRERQFQKYTKDGGIAKSIQSVAGTLIGLLLICVYLSLHIALKQSPEQYLAAMRYVKLAEDITASIVFMCMSAVLSHAYFVASYLSGRHERGSR
jgi:hypothetical protein